MITTASWSPGFSAVMIAGLDARGHVSLAHPDLLRPGVLQRDRLPPGHPGAAVQAHGAFAVNVLAAPQRHLSTNFARRGLAAAWDGVRHRQGPTRQPWPGRRRFIENLLTEEEDHPDELNDLFVS
jgi:hypothetical protein